MKSKLIDPEKLREAARYWAMLTATNQQAILVAYFLAAMHYITDDDSAAEVICNHEGGGPSWAKKVLSRQSTQRYCEAVHWMQCVVHKSQSGNAELILNEYGHFAQVVIWALNSFFTTASSAQKFEGDKFIAHCMEYMLLAVCQTLDLAIRHAQKDVEPELPLG